MGILTNLYQPRDPRWNGTQKAYFRLTLVKNAVFVGYIILVIIETVSFFSWLDSSYSGWKEGAGASFWIRNGIAIAPEIVHIPLQLYLIATSKYHPITALVSAICFFGFWFSVALLNGLATYSSLLRFSRRDTWRSMCYAETGLQALLTVLYGGMIGFAGVAVHGWRMAKRNRQDVSWEAVSSGKTMRNSEDVSWMAVSGGTTMRNSEEASLMTVSSGKTMRNSEDVSWMTVSSGKTMRNSEDVSLMSVSSGKTMGNSEYLSLKDGSSGKSDVV